jgi:hypothetical protein
VSKLTAEREALLEQQLEQIRYQREQKKARGAGVHQAAAPFPELGGGGRARPVGRPAAPPVGKHGALAKAKALAGDAQRTPKVLSLDMKTHKLTQTRTKRTNTAPASHTSQREGDQQMAHPFVRRDGQPLVRDAADDALAPRSDPTPPPPAQPALLPRRWCLAGQLLDLVPP